MKLLEALLWLASIFYRAGARLRSWSYDAGIARAWRLNGVVVSVGNITTGGTGKTPMVIWLAERFLQIGERTGILSRGYRPLPSDHLAESAGNIRWNDEMALIHERLGANAEYGVDANRFRAGKQLESRGTRTFILDDGLQHLQLARDVNIVMLDAMNPFGGGHVLPAGRLREPLSALRRADIVVIHRAASLTPSIEVKIGRHTSAPVFHSQTELLDLRLWKASDGNSPSASGRKFFAFCGIGNPSAFIADLKRWGISVAGQKFFHDHHRYTQQDLRLLERSAEECGADSLICTEKDTYDFPPGAAPELPLFFCRIKMKFDDEEGLWRYILARIQQKRADR